jgi:predicted transcriptional regulator of viral defense system
MTMRRLCQSNERLGRSGAAIIQALREADRRVLALPDDWSLIDSVVEDRQRARVTLHRLARSGWLAPVRRGLYAVRSEEGSLRISALELVDLATRGPHLVTAGAALALRGLSDQAFRELIVAVPWDQTDWEWLGTRVHYVRVPAEKLWGGREHRFRGGFEANVATAERAILDGLAHPGWGVTESQVTEAIDRALRREPAFVEKLALATARYGNTMLARRIGFLVERLAGPEAASTFLALRGRTHASAELVAKASAVDDAVLDSRWRVRENVAVELLMGHREAQ